MEDSVEAHLAAVSREPVLLYAVLYLIPYTEHLQSALCTTWLPLIWSQLNSGEVVYLVNDAESVWDLLHFHRRQLMLWVCSVKG